MGAPEIGLIAAVIVLLFGAKKLPELAGSVGKSIKEFRKATEEDADDEATSSSASDEA